MITFFDLASKDGIKTWSPSSWKTRYVLNYKKLSYQTVALEYPEVEGVYKELGIPPSGTKPDGTDLYTSPSIIDRASNTPVTDSYKIGEYLDKAYPSTPPVFPPGSHALQAAFYEQFYPLMGPSVRPLILPRIPGNVLNPQSAEYYTRTRPAYLGKPLADFEPKGDARKEAWKKFQEAFDTLNKWWSKGAGPFLMGETITFSDFVVASLLNAIRVSLGEESEEWKNIQMWNDGRWKTLLTQLEPYASTEN